jgi:ParB-like nuclease domain
MTANAHGPKPELTWLPLSRCHVDHRYQRTLESERSQALVERLAKGWRWASCGALLAVKDGKDRYLLLDGQHRAEAARRIGIKELPALVVAGLSLEEQAAAFVRANLDRVAVNAFALHHARLVAGDERAALVDRVCRAAGISIPKYPIPADNLKPGQTLALASIAQLALRLGEGGASAVLTAIADAYRDQAGCIRASLLRAVGKLYEAVPSATARDQARPKITDWLRRNRPADLFIKAARRKESYGGTDADNLAALIKGGLGLAVREPQASARPLEPSGIKAPTKAQLMGRR